MGSNNILSKTGLATICGQISISINVSFSEKSKSLVIILPARVEWIWSRVEILSGSGFVNSTFAKSTRLLIMLLLKSASIE